MNILNTIRSELFMYFFTIGHPTIKCFMRQQLYLSAFNFLLSVIVTWLFVISFPGYASLEQMLLSSSIAGGKWLLQIIIALLLLKNRAVNFINAISKVCLWGSLALIPFIVSSFFKWDSGTVLFVFSLVLAVAVMIVSYYTGVRKQGLSIYYFLTWLCSLLVAITLQLTVVFGVI